MRPTTVMDRTGNASTWVRRIVDEAGDVEEQPTDFRPSGAATVETIMSRTAVCVRPDVGVDSAIRLLLEHRMSGMPVVAADGRPLGVVTKTDLLRHLHEVGGEGSGRVEELDAGFHATPIDDTTVGDVMTPVVFALTQDVTIGRAAALMAGEGIHRLPILDDNGAVIGILSTLDLARWIALGAGYAV